jgi:hypothetical protein
LECATRDIVWLFQQNRVGRIGIDLEPLRELPVLLFVTEGISRRLINTFADLGGFLGR